MFRKNTVKRALIVLFALWLCFEPMVVSIVRAEGIPSNPTETSGNPDRVVPPPVNTKFDEGFTVEEITEEFEKAKLDEYILPGQQLERLFKAFGKTKEEIENRSWADTFLLLSNSFNLLDEESHDAVSFMGTMAAILGFREKQGIVGAYYEVFAPKFTNLFQVPGKGSGIYFRLFEGMKKIGLDPQELDEGIETGLKFACGSTHEAENVSAVKWFLRAPAETGAAKAFEYVKKVGAGIGVAIDVIGLVVGAISFTFSDDMKGGDPLSWNQVKTLMGIATSIAGLIALWVPGLGTAVAIASIVIMVIQKTADEIGEARKKWLECYADSFNFLIEKDERFKQFHSSWRELPSENWALSLEKAQGDFMKSAPYDIAAGGPVVARQFRICERMINQGVLMSYYGSKALPLKQADVEELKKLWQVKATFMAWQPPKEEAEGGKSWAESFWDAITQPNPAMFKELQKSFEESLAEFGYEYVYFNPDFALMKIFSNYRAGTIKEPMWSESPVVKALPLRLEQAPFNYLPLLEIPTSRWDENLLREAFQADCFLAGTKQLVYLRAMVDNINKEQKAKIEKIGKEVKDFEADLPRFEKERKALEMLLDAPGSLEKDSGTRKKIKTALLEAKLATADILSESVTEKAAIAQAIREKVAPILCDRPGAIGYFIVRLIAQGMIMKQAIDRAKILQAVHAIREKGCKGIEDRTEFKNPEIQTFLETGDVLSLKGSNWAEKAVVFVADKLGWVKPPLAENKYYLKLLKGSIEENQEISQVFMTGFLKKFGSYKLKELIKLNNEELAKWKEVSAKWQALSEETAGDGFPAEGETSLKAIWGPFDFPPGIFFDHALELPPD